MLRVAPALIMTFRIEPGEVLSWNFVILPVIVILNALDSEEGPTQHQGSDEESDDQLAAAHLRRVHRHGHGQRREDQHHGVDRTELDVHALAAVDPRLVVREPVDQVRTEHATEEHDFGDEENPHAECGGFPLLFHVAKMMLQLVGYNRLAILQRRPPPGAGSRSRRLPRLQPASCRSYGWAAAKRSSTPNRPRSTDC